MYYNGTDQKVEVESICIEESYSTHKSTLYISANEGPMSLHNQIHDLFVYDNS